MNPAVLNEISAAGVSLWLDDLDRTRLAGGLESLIAGSHITGVTTNPTIFDRAISAGSAAYQEQLATLAEQGLDADAAIRTITTDDVRSACDILLPTYQRTGGLDGRVSIEVDPRLAHDHIGTVEQARELWRLVNRPNAMIKIPATKEGLPAISDVLAEGISVNVTLIFAIDRYQQVLLAHAEGLRRAAQNGHDLRAIDSVASFFVSRVDAAVDAQLDALGTDADTRAGELRAELRGEAAIANARLAWQAYLDHCAGEPWQQLLAAGARAQRPLWASTGVKDPAYDPTRYVLELIAPGCVNTLPEPTLDAVIREGRFRGDTITGTAARSAQIIERLAELGIDIDDVCAQLESAGVQAFIESWQALRATVGSALAG